MRKEFSGIGAVSMVTFFLAATVVCLQLVHSKVLPAWPLPAGVIWMLEIALFGLTVYLWRRAISLGAWLLAIAAGVAVRLGITYASAFAYSLFVPSVSHQWALTEMNATLPRLCTAFFALVVLYPLRSLLPERSSRSKARARSDSPAVAFAFQDAQNKNDAEDPALWFVRGEEKIPVWLDAQRGGGADTLVASSPPTERIEGDVEIPVREILAQIPQEFVSEKADRLDGSEMVPFPLAAILPQLKEARVVVRFDELCERLPDGVIDASETRRLEEAETPLVLLPLELVVPRLPEGVFSLPAPSPPAWAKLELTDKVVFART